MKKLLPTPIPLIVLDATGSAYSVVTEFGRLNLPLIISDATNAYRVEVNQKVQVSLTVLDATGSAYVVGCVGIEVAGGDAVDPVIKIQSSCEFAYIKASYTDPDRSVKNSLVCSYDHIIIPSFPIANTPKVRFAYNLLEAIPPLTLTLPWLSVDMLTKPNHKLNYSILVDRPTYALFKSLVTAYDLPEKVYLKTTTTLPYEDAVTISSSASLVWRSIGVVASTDQFNYTLLDKDVLVVTTKFKYQLQDLALQQISASPTLYRGATPIDFISIDLSCDEASPFWICDVEVAQMEDFKAFSLGDAVAVVFNEETFNLIVDGKNMSRGDNSDIAFRLTLISNSALLDVPFHKTITKLYSTPTLASEIVSDLLGEVDWQIADWVISPSQCQWVDSTPLAISRQIAEAVGGLVETNPDGSIVVRKTYPVSIPDYATATCTPFNDTDLFDVREQIAPAEMFNRVDIYNTQIVDAGLRDLLEYVQDDTTPLKGVVRGYPSPYRNVSLAHTGIPETVIETIGDYTRSETEMVEFLAGKGNTQYPVDSITSMSWNATVLGAVTFSGDQLTSAVPAESLLNITYVVKSKKWNVSGIDGSTVQFVLEAI